MVSTYQIRQAAKIQRSFSEFKIAPKPGGYYAISKDGKRLATVKTPAAAYAKAASLSMDLL